MTHLCGQISKTQGFIPGLTCGGRLSLQSPAMLLAPAAVIFLVHFNRFSRLGLVVLLVGPIVLAVAALAGLIPVPRIAEDVVDLLVGIELVVFSFLNVRYELTRRWLKGLGWLGQPPFSLPTDSKFGRLYYGPFASAFALVVGLGWTIGPLLALVGDFRR
jgi:hypothetical protein